MLGGMKCGLHTTMVLDFPGLETTGTYEGPHVLNPTAPSGKTPHADDTSLRGEGHRKQTSGFTLSLEKRAGKMGPAAVGWSPQINVRLSISAQVLLPPHREPCGVWNRHDTFLHHRTNSPSHAAAATLSTSISHQFVSKIISPLFNCKCLRIKDYALLSLQGRSVQE